MDPDKYFSVTIQRMQEGNKRFGMLKYVQYGSEIFTFKSCSLHNKNLVSGLFQAGSALAESQMNVSRRKRGYQSSPKT